MSEHATDEVTSKKEKADEFYFKEYESLRSEIESTVSDARALELNMTFAVGAN
jgi:hypothetical protein